MLTPDQITQSKVSGPGWIGWLLIAAAVAIVISIILQILTPRPKPLPISATADGRQNMDGSATIFNNVVYKGIEPDFPNKLPIVTAEMSDQAAAQVVTYLADYYKLSPHPDLPDGWANDDYLLYKNNNNHEYLMVIKNGLLTQPSLSLEAAKKTAEGLLQGYPNLSALSVINDRTKYYHLGDGAHGEEVTPPGANTIALEYSWKIQETPVFLPKRYEGGFVITIGSDLKPVRISLPLTIPTFGAQVSMEPVLTIKDAVAQINQSNGSIIYAEQSDGKPFDVSKISSAQLDNVTLEYRIDPEAKLAIPYYRFNGLIKNTNGSIYTAQLLTPAVLTTLIPASL